MESALYGIYALVFVSEILIRQQRVRNTVRPHFPWSILYILDWKYNNLYLKYFSQLLQFPLV